jgi:hypothetical protein
MAGTVECLVYAKAQNRSVTGRSANREDEVTFVVEGNGVPPRAVIVPKPE